MKNKIYLIALILTLTAVCSPAARHPRPSPTPSSTPTPSPTPTPTPSATPNPYQTSNTNYGVSGGNVNDITNSFCCSGTLGSLVTAGGTLYILSNNHVLARQDQATAGENISQPGLIDNNCRPATTVANYYAAVPLGNNVDCAVATLNGPMNTSGNIEGIGWINSSPAPAAVGMHVQKSGRTTGHTMGTIGSTNTSVNVQYQIRCGSGQKYTVSYTNQVVINSSGFSAGGDSGSLIVTNESCPHPVALLFAGSSSDTIGNPIDQVLTKLSAVLGGATVTFVGGCAGAGAQDLGVQSFQLPQQALDAASRILERNRHDLMSKPAVLGVGLGALEDNSAPAIVVYVDKTSQARPQLPDQVDNVPVRIIMTDPFVAY